MKTVAQAFLDKVEERWKELSRLYSTNAIVCRTDVVLGGQDMVRGMWGAIHMLKLAKKEIDSWKQDLPGTKESKVVVVLKYFCWGGGQNQPMFFFGYVTEKVYKDIQKNGDKWRNSFVQIRFSIHDYKGSSEGVKGGGGGYWGKRWVTKKDKLEGVVTQDKDTSEFMFKVVEDKENQLYYFLLEVAPPPGFETDVHFQDIKGTKEVKPFGFAAKS
jgi:hypothetical protein